ncbi:MAG TPA: protein kinase, partial [Acidobacteriota bacterium]|nr:protein kinase [Acidobacteriota bacterium]
FEKEAKALAALGHPNILTIFEFGTDAGVAYTVTEILEGESLRARMLRSSIPWRHVVKICTEIIEGIAAAHSKGIIHRDLKPENIFLLSDGRVKILDFGLARWTPHLASEDLSHVSTEMPPTDANRVLGTLPYMSPEQLSGSQVDARSDIFSFGCIVYEMISGTHPFLKKSLAETSAAILKEEPQKPSPNENDLPDLVKQLSMRCLRKNPNDRYQSAKEIAHDLDALHSNISGPIAGTQSIPVRSKIAVFLVLAIIIGVMVAGVWWVKTRSASPAIEKSIAVLPFNNLTDQKEEDYFSDGITEDIITQLSKVRDLKVISRTSSMRFKKSTKSLKEIADELNVAAVLEGSVRRQGDRLRIVAQLIDADTDNHIWAETYDREMKDIFAIQSDVAQKIAAALEAELSPEERKKIEQTPTNDVTAYDFYLKGRQYYLRYQKESNETAIQLYQKAIQIDPKFALAYVGLCDAYSMRPGYGVPGNSLDLAIEFCNKAISIDPDLALAYGTIYKPYMFKGLAEKANQALNKAYELDPNDPLVVGRVGTDHLNKGRLVEAYRFTKRNIELDPSNAFGYFTMGILYFDIGDLNQAEAFLKKSIELQPDLAFASGALARVYVIDGKTEEALKVANTFNSIRPGGGATILGIVYELSGNYHSAVEYFKKGNVPSLIRFAHAIYKVGATAEAEKMLDALLQETNKKIPSRNMGDLYDLACIYAIRDNNAEALKLLKQAADAGFCTYRFIQKDPIFEHLRTDPKFQQIMNEMKSKATEIRSRISTM